jgi:hypothetical protein
MRPILNLCHSPCQELRQTDRSDLRFCRNSGPHRPVLTCSFPTVGSESRGEHAPPCRTRPGLPAAALRLVAPTALATTGAGRARPAFRTPQGSPPSRRTLADPWCQRRSGIAAGHPGSRPESRSLHRHDGPQAGRAIPQPPLRSGWELPTITSHPRTTSSDVPSGDRRCAHAGHDVEAMGCPGQPDCQGLGCSSPQA